MKIVFTRDALKQNGIDFTVRCAECNRDLTHLIDLEVDEVLHEENPALVFVSMKTVWCSKCGRENEELRDAFSCLEGDYQQLDDKNGELERDLEERDDEISDLKKRDQETEGRMK